MSALFARIGGFFVEPPATAEVEPPAIAGAGCQGDATPQRANAPAAEPGGGVGLVASPADVRAAAGALALELARRRHSASGVVCLWTGADDDEPAWRMPAAPAARQLATALSGRGLATFATGKLAVVRLPAGEAAAVAAAGVALGATGTPVVVAVGAPRGDALDHFLATVAGLVVALGPGAPSGLAALALARAPGTGTGAEPSRRVALLELPSGPAARLLAAAGVAVLPSLAGPVARAADVLA